MTGILIKISWEVSHFTTDRFSTIGEYCKNFFSLYNGHFLDILGGLRRKKFEDEGSGDSLPLTLQRTFEQKKTGVNRNFPFHITNGHFFCVCPEIFRRFQKSLYYTTDIFSPFFKYRGIKRCPYFRESRDLVICGY